MKTLFINGKEYAFDKERNILEICRRENIYIPTFCYQPDLSVFGACRMCIVEIDGRGIQTSCSTPPEEGMKITTESEQIQKLRRINLELILASHPDDCLTCGKSGNCRLQEYARRFGVDEIRFNRFVKSYPEVIKQYIPNEYEEGRVQKDISGYSLVRDSAKCILCGCCVRACSETQSVGAIDFAFRGSNSFVLPAFGKGIGVGECVNCGQCAAVCPVGALLPRNDIDKALGAIYDKSKIAVVAIAPSVRVGLGDEFGDAPGEIVTGKIVSALKEVGFDYVYDICHGADFTIVEEGTEFIRRKTNGENLPQFTSCCPGWVKFIEQYYPELLNHLSSCKSPQQMFGAFAKDYLPKLLGKKREDIVIVSVMPCTAKKFEAKRPEFAKNGNPDIDIVLTTQELGIMFKEKGVDFNRLPAGEFDKPLGVQTGAAVIFGVSGGVTEAALRFAAEKLTGTKKNDLEFKQLRGEEKGIRRAKLNVGDVELKLALVSGLANAREILENVKKGKENSDLIEVMACPGGCINGGGQPYHLDTKTFVRKARAKALYKADKSLPIHNSQDNPDLQEQYKNEIDGHKAHELFHTSYTARK